MSEGFGARLRRQREEQGIALPTIAGHTKIKQSLLEALERDDVSQWPSGIFRRAYVRSYAQAIGLDPDAIAAEFVRVHPDPSEAVTTEAIAATLDGSRGRTAPPTRLRYIVGSALGSLTRFGRAPAALRQVDQADAGSHALPPGLEPDLPLAVDPSAEALPSEYQLQPDHGEAFDPLLTDAVDTERQDGTTGAELDPVFESNDAEIRPAVESREVEFEPVDDRTEMVETAAVDVPPATAAAIAEDDPEGPVVGEHRPSDAAPAGVDPDLAALAALCTELGRAGSADAVQLSLHRAGAVLGSTGLIVWLWDRWAGGLRPALAHGYSNAVVAQLPLVRRDADNATAAAFRSARPCATDGGAHGAAALVLPLLTPAGCAGVLAIELEHGRAQMPSVRAAATILAAQLATLAGEPANEASGAESTADVAMDPASTSR
jgi:transcriptional regulator with XRE-family HTH domain